MRISVSENENRIDAYLAGVIDGATRSHIQKMLVEGKITVNGSPVKANYKLRAGDIIDYEEEIPEDPDILPEDIPLDILYEDPDILIVNKPKGMVVHPANGHENGTLVNAIIYHCGDSLSGINGIRRPGIVHRIDKDTTGVLVIAKNDEAHQKLSDQLKVHSITRKYRALVHGVIREDGKVDAPIGRHPNDRKKMSVHAKVSREAVTHYHILESFAGYTYIECCLETGRTHQIRVHMASIHHPVVGDEVYGPAKCPFKGLRGQSLHAMILGFNHPRTGEYMEFEAPLPEYFEDLLNKLRKKDPVK